MKRIPAARISGRAPLAEISLAGCHGMGAGSAQRVRVAKMVETKEASPKPKAGHAQPVAGLGQAQDECGPEARSGQGSEVEAGHLTKRNAKSLEKSEAANCQNVKKN